MLRKLATVVGSLSDVVVNTSNLATEEVNYWSLRRHVSRAVGMEEVRINSATMLMQLNVQKKELSQTPEGIEALETINNIIKNQ